MNDYKWKIDCDISPRELSYALSEFHRAPSGDGALGFTWQEKPHRIVYDLIAAVKYYAMRVAELESRLEISPLHNVDGIMARDATIKLQDERIAELEAERAEREKQEPVLYVQSNHFAQAKFSPILARVCQQPIEGISTLPLYAAPPVTAPVRLTDEQVEHALRTNGAYESDAAYAMAKDGLLTEARAIETAILRANGFKVDE